jgi:hypothetical protein
MGGDIYGIRPQVERVLTCLHDKGRKRTQRRKRNGHEENGGSPALETFIAVRIV